MRDAKIVLLYSGGLDSTALLWQLLKHNNHVLCVNVDYGQRHFQQEHASADKLVLLAQEEFQHLNIDLITLKIDYNRHLSNNALTNHDMAVPLAEYTTSSIAGTVVPGRNATFLAMAYGVAYSYQYEAVAIAVHGGDHVVYPDCRPSFVQAMKTVFSLMDDTSGIYLYAPFLFMTKADIAYSGHIYQAPLGMTYSCYQGEGMPCGQCATCKERKSALDEADLRLRAIGR